MKIEDKWGIIERLVVTADNRIALKSAITIALVESTTVSHWYVEDNVLHLKWAKGKKEATELLSPLSDPEEITRLVIDWLDNTTVSGKEPNTDGSVNYGFSVSGGGFYDVCQIEPVYIVYGK